MIGRKEMEKADRTQTKDEALGVLAEMNGMLRKMPISEAVKKERFGRLQRFLQHLRQIPCDFVHTIIAFLPLEFTHFLTAKVHLAPINKGWCALSQVKWAFSPGKKKLRALGLPLPLRSFAMSQRQFSASNRLFELPSAGLEDMTTNPCMSEEVWRRRPPAQSRHASLSETRMIGAKQMRFYGAVARALLVGVKFGGFGERLIGRS